MKLPIREEHRLLVAVLRVHDRRLFCFPVDVILVEREGFRDSHARREKHFAERPSAQAMQLRKVE